MTIPIERWTAWEQPWTRQGGPAAGYRPMTADELKPGAVIALRQTACPYLPTFAPWWIGLTVRQVDIVARHGEPVVYNVRFFETAMLAETDRFPLDTHWAILP